MEVVKNIYRILSPSDSINVIMLIGLQLPKSYIDLATMVAVCKVIIPIKNIDYLLILKHYDFFILKIQ